jgi:hypothetical protein
MGLAGVHPRRRGTHCHIHPNVRVRIGATRDRQIFVEARGDDEIPGDKLLDNFGVVCSRCALTKHENRSIVSISFVDRAALGRARLRRVDVGDTQHKRVASERGEC